MADVLSQSQIDMLLNSMRDDGEGSETAESEAAPKKTEDDYKNYDFYSPKKFTKDKLKLIKGIYDNYCRILSSQLNGVLRINCELEVLAVEEQRYHEFSNALTENDVMELMFLKLPDDTKNPPLMVHITPQLMVNMMDRMLGGEGEEADVDFSYTYTEIELALYRRAMEYFSGAIRDAYRNYITLDVESQRLEESPSMFQDIGLDEPVAIIMLNMQLPSVSGIINICMPGNLLMNIFTIIDKRKHIDGTYDNGIKNGREVIMDKLKESALDVKVELGTARLSFQDVCDLRVEDVIDLGKPSNEDVTVYVAEQPWFTGRLGVRKKNVAVRLGKKVLDEPELLVQEEDKTKTDADPTEAEEVSVD